MYIRNGNPLVEKINIRIGPMIIFIEDGFIGPGIGSEGEVKGQEDVL